MQRLIYKDRQKPAPKTRQRADWEELRKLAEEPGMGVDLGKMSDAEALKLLMR